MSEQIKEIIIVKRSRHHAHAGAHGGAWKIAYADFVTAMMAFFLVMWIIGLDVQTKRGIAEYFQNMSARAEHAPSSPYVVHLRGSPLVRPRLPPVVPREDNLDRDAAKQLASQLESLLHSSIAMQRLVPSVAIIVSDQGLRIDMLDGDGSAFATASTVLSGDGQRFLSGVGAIVQRLRSVVYIESQGGRTASVDRNGDSWSMAAARSVAVRQVLVNNSLGTDRIASVATVGEDQRAGRVSVVIPFDL